MLIAAPIVVFGLLWALPRDHTRRIIWVLATAAALPTTAALPSVGGLSAYFVVGVVMVAFTILAWLRGRLSFLGWPGARTLAVFFGYGLVITAIGPTLFDGMRVLKPAGGIDYEVLNPSRLTYFASNISQVLLLVIAFAVICLAARAPLLSAHTLSIGLAIAAFASTWRWTSDQFGVPFPAAQFDSTETVYNNGNASEYRLRGVFPEPSFLGIYSVVTMAFCAVMIAQTRGRTRLAYCVVFASASVNFALSRSGTGLIGGLAVGALMLGVLYVRTTVLGRSPLPLVILAIVGVIAVLANFHAVYDFVVEGISKKTGSGSYRSRSSADLISFRIFSDSYGLGVGLGSSRPSSMWPALLSCVGLVGTIAYAVFCGRLASLTWRATGAHLAVFWALVAILVTKSFNGSDLFDPLTVMILACNANLAAHLVREARERRREEAAARAAAAPGGRRRAQVVAPA